MSFVSEGYKNFVKTFVVDYLNENGKLPTKKAMYDRKVSIDPLISSYGRWDNVLKALGFDKEKLSETIDPEEVMAKLKDLKESLGTIPTLNDVKQENIQIKVLIEKFGSWTNVKRVLSGDLSEDEAQDEDLRNKGYTLEEVTESLINLTKELKSIPTLKQVKDNGIKVNILLKEYKSWTNVKNELGLYNIEESTIVEKVKDLQKETIKRPTMKAAKEKQINIRPLLKKYKNWKNVCNVFNIDLYDLDVIKDKIFEIAESLDRTPTVYELKDCYQLDITPLTKEYGGWYKFVEEEKLYEFNDNRVKKQIRGIADALDKTPTIKDLKENHVKFSKLFKRHHGWHNVRELMGLPKYSRFTNSELKEIEQQIIALGSELGRTPRLCDIKQYKIHVSPLINRYGSWNNLLFKLGFKLNNRYTDEAIESLTKDIIALSDKLGRTPTMQEVKENEIPLNPLSRKYGSFGRCLMALGLKPRVLPHDLYDREAIFAELQELSNKLGKIPSKNAAKENGIKVHSLVKDLGNWTKVKEAIIRLQENTTTTENVELRLA